MDPKRLGDSKNYKLDEKSDVYSIGVLMWQISSSRRPFCNVEYDEELILSILSEKRKEVIVGTPAEYSNVYKGSM